MTLEFLYPLFIVAGFVIIVVLIYLRTLSRKTIHSFLELIDLNTRCNFDLHSFLTQVRPVLTKIEIEDYYYTIHYLESTIEKPKSITGEPLEKIIERSDYTIKIGIVPRRFRGEWYYLNLIILEILSLLLETDVLIKIKVFHEAMYKFSRLQTLVLHDIKNLVQFIESLSYNVHHLESVERTELFLNYLKESLPVQSRRGAKIINLLEIERKGDGEAEEQTTLKMKPLLENLMRQYNLTGTVRGEASITAEEFLIISLFDNILRNIYDKSLVEGGLTCSIDIQDFGDCVKVTITDTGSPPQEQTRLFEPFYSTKKGGLGIGLFLSKHIASTLKGDVRSIPHTSGARFEVILPSYRNV